MKDHFEQGNNVANLCESDLFNQRGIKRINLFYKQSHVFDAFT